jgi:hypothetical protein
MKKSTSRRLSLCKETLRALEKDASLEQVLGGAFTQIQTCNSCTSDCSYCTN